MIERVRRVLDAIPYDSWVSAAEVAAETGISSSRVGALISKELFPVSVERKKRKLSERGSYLYRRIRFVGSMEVVS